MSKKFGFLFWLHLIIILGYLASPFFLSWKIILGFIILYYIQLAIFGNCILTLQQFKSKKRKKTRYGFTLEELGIKINGKSLSRFTDYILPWIVLGLAIFLQTKPL